MKTIIVTGATMAGIGSAVTEALCSAGYWVTGTFEKSDEDRATALLKSHSNLSLHEVDHSSRKSLQDFASIATQRAPLAGLVNCQMYFEMEDPSNFDFSIWDRSLAINLTAPMVLFHALKDHMERDSSVVTITSTEGFMGSFGASAYSATKAAIHNLTKTLANISGGHSLRVNAVAPGWIGGVMDTDEIFNLSRKITPLARLGAPDEIARIVLFLLSEQSSFVNGAVIVADGGYSGVDTISKFEYDASRKGLTSP